MKGARTAEEEGAAPGVGVVLEGEGGHAEGVVGTGGAADELNVVGVHRRAWESRERSLGGAKAQVQESLGSRCLPYSPSSFGSHTLIAFCLTVLHIKPGSHSRRILDDGDWPTCVQIEGASQQHKVDLVVAKSSQQ